MEDVYFAEGEGRPAQEWTAFRVLDDGRWQRIDAFGEGLTELSAEPIPGLSRRGEDGWQIGASELRRARDMTCWFSVRKFAAKPDGSDDWTFANNLPVYDQGGRVFLDGEGIAPDVTMRVRNVTWAKGSSTRPALVLYAHRDDPARAESYAWTSPDAGMVGINLRWVQGSCSPVQPDGE
jgi:hypothetical protein